MHNVHSVLLSDDREPHQPILRVITWKAEKKFLLGSQFDLSHLAGVLIDPSSQAMVRLYL